jgi:hypothetical protein
MTMSISEYVSTLDLDQLWYLMKQVKERIEGIEREKKRAVWLVLNDGYPQSCFPEDGYLDAAQALLEKARELAGKPGTLDEKRLELRPGFIRESEYKEYGFQEKGR